MEANELRLGNYIRNMYGEVIKVDLKALKEVSKGELFGVVELTEEILLKCGFEKFSEYIFSISIDNGWFLNIESNYIFLNYKENECEVSHFEYKYLHQLQNIYFALTGKELNVKL